MIFEESEGVDNQTDDEAFEQLSEDADSNYPNETDDAPTFDSNEQLRRIRAKKAKMLESEIIENPNSSDGNKTEYSVDENYSVKEGQRRTPIGSDNSEQPKSPLQ
jgi:hypothetical protein